MIVNGVEWSDGDMASFAESERVLHDPARQEGNGYERCELCHFTRHPCDVHDLASMVLGLLDRGER